MAGQTVIVSVLADTKRFNSAMAGTDKTLTRFSNSIRAVGRVGQTVFAGLGYAIARFSIDAVKSAADLESSIIALDAVFGESSTAINAWGKQAAKSLGLSNQAYNQLATRLGGALSTRFKKQNVLAEKTNELMQIGAALAAQYGLTTQDALDRINAGLIGEYDGLQKILPAISAQAIYQTAVADGYKGTQAALTASQKAYYTYKTIVDQSKGAVDNFNKSSDTTNFKLAILQATWTNFSAAIGVAANTVLGPALTELTDYLTKFANSKEAATLGEELGKSFKLLAEQLPGIVDGITKFFKFLNDNNISIAQFIAYGYGASTMLGVLGNAFGDIYAIFQSAGANKLAQQASHISSLNTQLSLAEKNASNAAREMDSFWNVISTPTKDDLRVLDQLQNDFNAATASAKLAEEELAALGATAGEVTAKSTGIAGIWSKISGFFTGLGDSFVGILKGAGKFLGWTALIIAAIDVLIGVWKGFSDAWNQYVTENPGKMDTLKKAWDGIMAVINFVSTILEGIGYVIGVVIAHGLEVFALLLEPIVATVEFLAGLWDDIVAAFNKTNGGQTGSYNSSSSGTTYDRGNNTYNPYSAPTAAKAPAAVYNVTVNSLQPSAEVGRSVVKSIAEYQRTGGAR